jgi:adenine deaminase
VLTGWNDHERLVSISDSFSRNAQSMNSIVFRNANVFDGESQTLQERVDVIVKNGTIREIGQTPVNTYEDTEVVNCCGRVLMPGLIDAHVPCLCLDVKYHPCGTDTDVLLGTFRGTVSPLKPRIAD